jgi:hypothetical protein
MHDSAHPRSRRARVALGSGKMPNPAQAWEEYAPQSLPGAFYPRGALPFTPNQDMKNCRWPTERAEAGEGHPRVQCHPLPAEVRAPCSLKACLHYLGGELRSAFRLGEIYLLDRCSFLDILPPCSSPFPTPTSMLPTNPEPPATGQDPKDGGRDSLP